MFGDVCGSYGLGVQEGCYGIQRVAARGEGGPSDTTLLTRKTTWLRILIQCPMQLVHTQKTWMNKPILHPHTSLALALAS